MFNIQNICPEIFDDDPTMSDSLEQEGRIVTFDTTEILSMVDLESLNQDDIAEIRQNLGTFQVYVQLKKLVIQAQYCRINIYRVINVGKYIGFGSSVNRFDSANGGILGDSKEQNID